MSYKTYSLFFYILIDDKSFLYYNRYIERRMKMNKKIVISVLLIIVLIFAIGLIYNQSRRTNNKFKIVTSFYSTYIIARNIANNINDIEVTSIVTSTTGCIHDYTLTPSDMVKIEESNALVINGAGMESFVDDVKSNYPKLPIIEASTNITLIDGDSEEEKYNAHVWMDPTKYIEQINNVSKRLIEIDPKHKKQYEENTNNYIDKINNLITKMPTNFDANKNKKVIIFHDAFEYLANYLGLNIVYTVDMDHDTTLSANQINTIIKEIKDNDVKTLLVEKQFSNDVIKTIKNEVSVNVYTLDTVVTGTDDLDAYIKAMNNNINILKEAFYE